MIKKAKVGLNDGMTFGENAKWYLRINIGTNRATIKECLDRIKNAL